jgi:hypothetical protein
VPLVVEFPMWFAVRALPGRRFLENQKSCVFPIAKKSRKGTPAKPVAFGEFR